jgi:hypothetical protein
MKRKTKSIGMLVEPATTAVPTTDIAPPMINDMRRPYLSAVYPWNTPPKAAPAQNRALMAPIIEAVFDDAAAERKVNRERARVTQTLTI